MNTLTIPPSPNWYETNILATAPDGTLIYGASTTLVVLLPPEDEGKAAKVNTIPYAHNQRITTVALSPHWMEGQKFAATTSEDKSIKLWNIETLKLITSNNAHTANDSKLIAALFVGKDKIVAASEDGAITVWTISTKEITPINNLLTSKTQVSCLSSCPHASYIVAFGLKNGMIVIADLRGAGQVRYRLRTNEKSVQSLAWCPIAENVFPKVKVSSRIELNKSKKAEKNDTESKDDNIELNKSKKAEKNDTESKDDNIELNKSKKAEKNDTESKDDNIESYKEIEVVNEITKSSESLKISNETQSFKISDETEFPKINDKIESSKINDDIKLPQVNKTDFSQKSKSIKKYNHKKPNPWVNLKYLDDDVDEVTEEKLNIEEVIEKIEAETDNDENIKLNNKHENDENKEPMDFLSECLALKAKISTANIEKKSTGSINNREVVEDDSSTKGNDRKILKAGRKNKIDMDNSEVNNEKMEAEQKAGDKIDSECNEKINAEKKVDGKITAEKNEKMETEKKVADIIDTEKNDEKKTEAEKNGLNKVDDMLENNDEKKMEAQKSTCSEALAKSIDVESEMEKSNEKNVDGKKEKKWKNRRGGGKYMHRKNSNVEKMDDKKEKNDDNTEAKGEKTEMEGEKAGIKGENAGTKNSGAEMNHEIVRTKREKADVTGEKVETKDDKVETTIDEKALLKDDQLETKDKTAETSFEKRKVESIEVKAESPETANNIKTETLKEGGEETKESPKETNESLSVKSSDQFEKTSENATEAEPTKEYLLAACSNKGVVSIWRCLTDGRLQTKLTVVRQSRSHSRYPRNKDKNFIAMCWISPRTLLTSGCKAELLRWELDTIIDAPKILHNDHIVNLFSIAAALKKYGNHNSLENAESSDRCAWSFGQERNLLKTTVDSESNTLCCYPTIGSAVQVIGVSPIDPHKLAVGFTDGLIKLWDLSRPHVDYITMTSFKVKGSLKVITLIWHPIEESTIAYATEDGYIGTINTSNSSKPPTLFTHYFRSIVHRLEWGPMKAETLLYACAEGVIVIYDHQKPLNDPVLLKVANDTYITQFSWKPDGSLLAVAVKGGSVLLYDAQLSCVNTIMHLQKTVIALNWHPETSDEDAEKCNWLALGMMDGAVVIYDVLKNIEEVIVRKLERHAKFIKSVNWSPHEAGKLLTAGEDGASHVWNVADDKVVASYMNLATQPLNTSIFSPVDPDLVISGGRENMINVWRISEQNVINLEDIQKEVNRRANKKSSSTHGKSKEAPTLIREVSVTQKQPATKDILSSVSAHQGDVEKLLKDCRRLLEGADVGNNRVLQLFGGAKDVENLLCFQKEEHLRHNRFSHQQYLDVFSGSLGDTIKTAIETERLSPWLISMAPTVSPTLWQEACLAYARQLDESEKGDGIEAASYFLSCHKVEEAVDALCRKQLFREAVLLCKLRLSNDEEMLNNITKKWATYYLTNGFYEIAAQCFISMGCYEDAAKALFKRSDPQALELSMKLAEKAGNEEMVKAIKFRHDTFVAEAIKDNAAEVAEDALLNVEIEISAGNDAENIVKRDEVKNSAGTEAETASSKPLVSSGIQKFFGLFSK